MKTSLFYKRCKICLSDLKTHTQKSRYKTSKSPCCFPPQLPTFSSHCCSHPVTAHSPPDVKKCFCNERDVRGPAGIHSGRLRYSKSIWQLGPKSRALRAEVEQDACLSLLHWVIRLCLLLFSFLHACHSCRLAMQSGERDALHSPLISLYLCRCFMKRLFVSHCVTMSACVFFLSLHPQVLCHYAPSRGYSCTQQAVRNVLLLLPMTWSNPRMIRSPWWPPWLPAETEMGSLWFRKGWIQRRAWLCSRTTGLR